MKQACQLTCNKKKKELQVKGGQYYTVIILSDQYRLPFPTAVPTPLYKFKTTEFGDSNHLPVILVESVSCTDEIWDVALFGANFRCSLSHRPLWTSCGLAK